MPAACAREEDDGRLRVAATVAPLAGLVDRLAGDIAEVTVMIPPGASPISYEPSPSKVRAASSADLFVSVGHPAFAWEVTWLSGLLQPDGTVIIEGADGCDLLPDDPHVWLSLPCTRRLAVRLAEAVQRARPREAGRVAGALDSLLAEIDSLKASADSLLGGRRGASFLVLHPAWGYIARDYGLRQVSILEHGSGDAGPARLAAIVSQARALGLEDVVAQPQFSVDAALLVADELGGDPVMLDPLAMDWAQSYGRALHALAAQVGP